MNRILLSAIVLLCSSVLLSQERSQVDRLLDKMSIREKVAQLFIVAFSADEKDRATIEALNLVREEKTLGGVIVMNSDLIPATKVLNKLHSLSDRIPLLTTIDGEWGPAMRFGTITPFPRQMQLGALDSDSLIYKMGIAIGLQSKRAGYDVNFSPSVDINSNPKNPVINTRSFGENIEKVAAYGLAYMAGMKSVGVPGSAKHFPGHGDTDVDSHLALPELPFSRERIDSVELRPFKVLMMGGVDMVMVAHLKVPSLDNSGKPASISKPIITELLREELGYKGIIITDALNMKGVADYLKPEEIPLEAYKAGCDIILMPIKAKEAITIMEKAIRRGDISEEELDVRCRKMLKLKESLGILNERSLVDITDIEKNLNRPEYISLINDIANKSITLIDNKDETIPIRSLEDRIGYLSIGGSKNGKEMAEYLMRYTNIDTIILRRNYKERDISNSLNKLNVNGHIIVAMHNTDFRPQADFGLKKEEIAAITRFAENKKVTFVYFGNPLAIPYIEGREKFASFILGYNNTDYNNLAVAQIIFGANGALGRLPLSSGNLPEGYCVESEGGLRAKYGLPEDFNIDGDLMASASDSIIYDGINSRKFSGAQLVFMHKNEVIINRAYGDMNSDYAVKLGRTSELLTTLPLVAMLDSEGRLSITDFVREHIDVEPGMESAIIADLLMHRVGSEEDIAYNQKNIGYLKSIIEKVSESSEEVVVSNFYTAMGMNRSSYTDGIVKTNANDVTKLMTMVNMRGVYGGERYLSADSADMFAQYAFYYSSDNNGSLVWKDDANDLTIIFLNNGSNEYNPEVFSVGERVFRSALSILFEKPI